MKKNEKRFWTVITAAMVVICMTGMAAEKKHNVSAVELNLKGQKTVLEKLLQNAETGYKKGTMPAEKIWQYRIQCDQIRILLIRPEKESSDTGASGALLRWKAAAWRAKLMDQNFASGQLSEERMLLAQLAAKNAELTYLQSIRSIKNIERFKQIAARIINYPSQPISD